MISLRRGITLTIIIIISTTVNVEAGAKRDIQMLKMYCNTVSEMAYTIMDFRQKGLSISAAVDGVEKNEEIINKAIREKTSLNVVSLKSIVQDAYVEKQYETVDDRVKVSLIFQKKWVNICNKENNIQ
jgi:glutamate racemase